MVLEIRSFSRGEIVAFINLVFKAVDAGFVCICEHLKGQRAAQGMKFDIVGIFKHWLDSNDGFHYNITTVFQTKLLANCSYLHVPTVSDKNCTLARANEDPTVFAVVDNGVF